MNQRHIVGFAFFLLVLLPGCLTTSAPPLNQIDVIPADIPVSQNHQYAISVNVQGCHETGLPGVAISEKELKEAIEKSIGSSKVFQKIVDTGTEDYELAVIMLNQDVSENNDDMIATLAIYWKLTKRGEIKPVWQDIIPGKYILKYEGTFLGYQGAMTALEGAVKGNIREGIKILSELSL